MNKTKATTSIQGGSRERSLSRQTFEKSDKGVSRYVRLATLFRRNISSGRWPTGRQIPTIKELAESHGVARATVRQALGILEDEELIERFRAKGTFVTHKLQEQLWYKVETDWTGLLRSREGASIELLDEEYDVDLPEFPNIIGERAKSYRYLQRKHFRNEKPFLLADVYIDEGICQRVPRSSLSSTTALRLLNDIKDLEISDVRQLMTIGQADIDIAEMLEIHLNDPIATVIRSALDGDGRLILISDGIYRGDQVSLEMKLK
jgi:GntR family transcriptional regulator